MELLFESFNSLFFTNIVFNVIVGLQVEELCIQYKTHLIRNCQTFSDMVLTSFFLQILNLEHLSFIQTGCFLSQRIMTLNLTICDICYMYQRLALESYICYLKVIRQCVWNIAMSLLERRKTQAHSSDTKSPNLSSS